MVGDAGTGDVEGARLGAFRGASRFNGPQINAIIRSDMGTSKGVAEMSRQVVVVLYVLAMAAVIVGVDFAFFRNRFWERLAVNIGIVLVFGAFYLRFLGRP
jgi:hypothetical protein